MPLWPRRFFSDSAAQIPSDTGFARSSHHPASAAGQRLSDSPPPGCSLSFQCLSVPANSAPVPFVGSSAGLTVRQPDLPVSAPHPAVKLLFSRTFRLSRVDRPCRNNNRKAAATFPDCSDPLPEVRSPLPTSLECSAPADKTSRPRRVPDSHMVNPDKSAQTVPEAPPAWPHPWPDRLR